MSRILTLKGLGNDVLKAHSELGALGWKLGDQSKTPKRYCGVYEKGKRKAGLRIHYEDMVLEEL